MLFGGIRPTQANLGWLHPLSIISAVLGGLMLGLVAAVFTGRTAFLEPIASGHSGEAIAQAATHRAATVVLVALMAAKWALAGLCFARPAAGTRLALAASGASGWRLAGGMKGEGNGS